MTTPGHQQDHHQQSAPSQAHSSHMNASSDHYWRGHQPSMSDSTWNPSETSHRDQPSIVRPALESQNECMSPMATSSMTTGTSAASSALQTPLPVNPKHLQNMLTWGTRMIKYPSKGTSRPEERLIKVDLVPLQISWESKKKKHSLSTGGPS